MIKKFILIFICIILTETITFAEQTLNFVENHTAEILTTIRSQRTKVYENLDLSKDQLQIINNIDKRRYDEILPEILKLSELVQALDDLANSGECTIKKVNAVKKEFKPVQDELYNINRKYETELQIVLTKEQSVAYKKARKQIRKDLKQSNRTRYKN